MSITDQNGTTIEPIGGWRILANSTDRKTINLDAAPAEVRKISIEDTIGDAGTNNVTINASGSQLIDGSSSIALDVNYQRKVLKSTGTGWTVVATAVDGVNSRDTLTVSADSIEVRNEYTFPTADGTDGQVLKTDGNGTLTWEDESGGSSSSSMEQVKIVDPNFSTGNEANRSFTIKKHYQFSGVSANTWHDVITIRPYLTGTTNNPSASSFWATVGYRLQVMGNVGNVGTGCRSRIGTIQYNGSSAAASSADDTTLDSPISVQVSRSGWDATIQINANQPNATNFTGVVYLEMYFTRGQGTNGNNIEWNLA